MKTIIVVDISPPITYQAKFWFSICEPKCCWSIEVLNSLKCNISRKKGMMNFTFGMQRNSKIICKLILSICNITRKTWGMKLLFCLQIDTKVFYKVIVSFWVCVSRHAQNTQNNKFAISLQYLKENGKNEVDFSLQININDFFKLILSF